MTFNQRIAQHIRAYQDKHGLTNLEIASLLDIESDNYVAMLKNPSTLRTPMSMKMVRQMCLAFGLTHLQSARLILARSKYHPYGKTAFDLDVITWCYRVLHEASGQLRGATPAAA